MELVTPTVEEKVEVLIAVEVHAGVFRTRVIVLGWKPGLERQQEHLGTVSCQAPHPH